MEENQNGVNPNESENSKAVENNNSKSIGIIATLAVALVIVLIAFFMFAQRSAKSTVKNVAKSMEKADAQQLMDQIDPIGVMAFLSCYSSKGMDFEDFEDNYEKIVDAIKDGDYKIDITSAKKDSDNKKITKVTCDITAEIEGSKVKLKDIEIYTMKKGLKNYIIGIDADSLEDVEDQLYDIF